MSNDSYGEVVIKKSRFVYCGLKIKSKLDAINKIDYYKKKYYDAKHIVFGYVLLNYKKFTENGEPFGTSGSQILNVLEEKKLFYNIIIVARYFGGIMGTGNLSRAYKQTAENCVNRSKILTYEFYKEIIFWIDYKKTYDFIKLFEKIFFIREKEYFDNIIRVNVFANINFDLRNLSLNKKIFTKIIEKKNLILGFNDLINKKFIAITGEIYCSKIFK
ncbi:MAG: YigZ family protein [Clostridiales bacterium]|nr:YigZ family protein [Clostridiales bacterium]